MSIVNSVDAIVLDAGPILQNSPSISTLLSKSKRIFTSPSIVVEIKDVNARRRFETTLDPFLTVRTPSPFSIKFVTDFARKTGDLAVLSKADVDIISLAYELEHDKDDKDGQPEDDSIQQDRSNLAHDAVPASGAPKASRAVDKALQFAPAAPWASSQALSSNLEVSNDITLDHDGQMDLREGASGPLEKAMIGLHQSLDSVSVQNLDKEQTLSSPLNSQDSTEVIDPTNEREDHDSEDSEGWITPANIKRVQAAENDKSNSTSSLKAPIRTAIITTDFAMQNVILQIGLNLLSPNLNRISNIRTYVLRCHACFQTVKDTSKQFCPRCGKPTLTRVSCSTNSNGEFRIHLKKNMQWNHRGERYSIPKPVPGQSNGKTGKGKGGGKGGWGQDLILAEDQKEYQRAMGSNGRSKATDLMDEDYLPGILTGNRGRPGGRPKVGAGRNVNSKKRI